MSASRASAPDNPSDQASLAVPIRKDTVAPNGGRESRWVSIASVAAAVEVPGGSCSDSRAVAEDSSRFAAALGAGASNPITEIAPDYHSRDTRSFSPTTLTPSASD